MKKFFLNNWKKILIIIGAILIIMNASFKISSESNLIQKYLDSDIVIENDIIDTVGDTTGDGFKIPNGNSDIYRLMIFLGIAIIAVAILTSLGTGSSEKKKK